jgi:hypothetical protein
MKYRILVDNNRYIPQVYHLKEHYWRSFTYDTSEEITKNGTHIIGFKYPHEAEAFVYAEIDRQDPDRKRVWKSYEV